MPLVLCLTADGQPAPYIGAIDITLIPEDCGLRRRVKPDIGDYPLVVSYVPRPQMPGVVTERLPGRAGRRQQQARGLKSPAGEHVAPRADMEALSVQAPAFEMVHMRCAWLADDLRTGEAGDYVNTRPVPQLLPVFPAEIRGQRPTLNR